MTTFRPTVSVISVPPWFNSTRSIASLLGRILGCVFVVLSLTLVVAQETPPAEKPATPPAAEIHPYFQSRLKAQREAALNKYSSDATTETNVDAALDWLQRHQSADGRWDSDGFYQPCCKAIEKAATLKDAGKPQYDVGITGLAILAFLARGVTQIEERTRFFNGVPEPQSEETDAAGASVLAQRSETVAHGLEFLLSSQDVEGCFGERTTRFTYSHAIATQAVAEAYGMTGDETLRPSLEKAIAFILQCQNPGLGWRYGVRNGDNDTSVTTWMVMALRSADAAGIPVPPLAYRGARNWLAQAAWPGGRGVGYKKFGASSSDAVALLGKGSQTACTAMGRLADLLAHPTQSKNSKSPERSHIFRADNMPVWQEGREEVINIYLWHFVSLLCIQTSSAVSESDASHPYREWINGLKAALVQGQESADKGCASGSWPPLGAWVSEGGRVLSTALGALCLEACYRYPVIDDSMFPRKAEPPSEETVKRVNELVAKLGADEMAARQRATEELVELGEQALWPLRAEADHPDAEVRLRVREIIRRIEE